MHKKNNSEQMENKKSDSRYQISKFNACDSAIKPSDMKDGTPNETSRGHFQPDISDKSDDENSEMFKNHQDIIERLFNLSTKELDDYIFKREAETAHGLIRTINENSDTSGQNVNETHIGSNEPETHRSLLCKKSFPMRDDILQHVKTTHNVLPDKHLDAIVVAKVPSAKNTDLPSLIALEREKFASEASRKLRAKAEVLEADIRNTKKEICEKIMRLNFLSAKADAKKSCEMRGLHSEKVEKELANFLYNKLMKSGSSLELKLVSN